MSADTLNLLADLIALGLTLAVFSALLGDNPLYRLATHIFVGTAAGYAALIAYYNVLYPKLLAPLFSLNFSDPGLPLGALFLALFLILKSRPATTRAGSLATAFLVGVGSAVAVGGAVTGTLFPQISATFLSVRPVGADGLEKAGEAVVIIAGTLTSLLFFTYTARPTPGGGPPQRPAWLKPLLPVGQIFIGIAFGVMYAGALAAGLAYFAERVGWLSAFVQSFK